MNDERQSRGGNGLYHTTLTWRMHSAPPARQTGAVFVLIGQQVSGDLVNTAFSTCTLVDAASGIATAMCTTVFPTDHGTLYFTSLRAWSDLAGPFVESDATPVGGTDLTANRGGDITVKHVTGPDYTYYYDIALVSRSHDAADAGTSP